MIKKNIAATALKIVSHRISAKEIKNTVIDKINISTII
jgi:hypothetical protein